MYIILSQTVGAAAKQGIIRNASNTVSQVKRVLGRNFDDPVSQAYISYCPVKVNAVNISTNAQRSGLFSVYF